jgi:hypothetical protein
MNVVRQSFTESQRAVIAVEYLEMVKKHEGWANRIVEEIPELAAPEYADVLMWTAEIATSEEEYHRKMAALVAKAPTQ